MISRKKKWGLCLLIILVIVGVLVWMLLNYPRAWCVEHYVDAETGDRMHRRYVLFFPVSERVETTPFSRLVRSTLGEPNKPPRWEWVSVTDVLLMRICILGPYSGVPIECQVLMKAFDIHNLSEDARRELIEKYMQYLHGNPDERIQGFISLTLALERELGPPTGKKVSTLPQGVISTTRPEPADSQHQPH